MALTYTPPGELGSRASDFSLPGVDGQTYSLTSFKDAKALVVVFMCNHCPYVIAVQDRINALARAFQARGVVVVGINPNDSVKYPDDAFEAMKKRAREKDYVFPYLQDESQKVARAFGAVCTPDFYVYKNFAGFELAYRGRLDDQWKDPNLVKSQDLASALEAILQEKPLLSQQVPSMGCSIKWK